MLKTIDADMKTLIAANPGMFTASKAKDVMVEIRDFQTAGVVSFARGRPFYGQKPGRGDSGVSAGIVGNPLPGRVMRQPTLT